MLVKVNPMDGVYAKFVGNKFGEAHGRSVYQNLSGTNLANSMVGAFTKICWEKIWRSSWTERLPEFARNKFGELQELSVYQKFFGANLENTINS